MNASPPLLILTGPTASGKSELAVRLAERLGAELVSADSVMVYRGLEIGSAKPGPDLRARVPHHLIDVVNPDESYSVADWRAAALAVIGQVRAAGKRALIVGGTGLYIRALTDGLCAAPAGDPKVRAELEAAGAADPFALHRRLAAVDPVAAAKNDPANVRRTVRALEVYETTGRPFSAWWSETERPEWDLKMVALDLPREELYRRIDARTTAMWRAGLVEETKGLLARGYLPTLKPLQSLGYRQAVEHLQGKLTAAAAQEQIARATRHYAKRQLTWLRREPRAVWLDPSRETEIAVVLGGYRHSCRN